MEAGYSVVQLAATLHIGLYSSDHPKLCARDGDAAWGRWVMVSAKTCVSPSGGGIAVARESAGPKVLIVQAIAGHSGIQVTMSIYAHAAQEEQRKALRSLGERLA